MKGKLFQLQTTFAAAFGQLAMGLLNVWPSYTTSIYASNSTTPLSEPMTSGEESLLGSLPSLGAMVGSAIVGVLVNKLGRKNGGIVLALPFVISWAMISVTTSKMVVLVARFLGGVAGGGMLVYSPIFISEIAEDSFRGALASAPIVMYCTGTLISYLLGWTFSYSMIVWINIVVGIVNLMLIVSVTESPVFLTKQNRDEDARKSLAHYRGLHASSIAIQDEFTKLKQSLMPSVELVSVNGDSKADLKIEDAEKEKLNIDNVEPEQQKKNSALKLLFVSPSSQRAFLVVTIVISMQVFMGIVPVQVYAKKVFTETDPAKSDLYTVIFAVVMLCGALVTTAVADKAGRRILIISSSILVCLCVASLGYLLQSRTSPPWVTVLTLMLYCFTFMFGAGSVPYVLLAEVFVSEVQSLASMIIIEWVWFLNFFIIAVFPFMNNFLGIHGTFYCFAVMAIINSVIAYFIVPETKGLSNDQIQNVFLGTKKK